MTLDDALAQATSKLADHADVFGDSTRFMDGVSVEMLTVLVAGVVRQREALLAERNLSAGFASTIDVLRKTIDQMVARGAK